jgi:hypothetical protein
MPGGGRAATLAAAIALVVLTGGCGGRSDWDEVRDAAGNGDAVRQIQAYFDKHPQCVRALRPATVAGLMAADRGDSAARALRDAGLIDAVAGAGDEDRYRPAAAAGRWFNRRQTAGVTEYELCFARRRISHAVIDMTGAEPGVRYDFSLDNPAPWMATTPIKTAFPAVQQAMLATYPGQEKLPFRNGRLVFDDVEPTSAHPTLFAFGVTFK